MLPHFINNYLCRSNTYIGRLGSPILGSHLWLFDGCQVGASDGQKSSTTGREEISHNLITKLITDEQLSNDMTPAKWAHLCDILQGYERSPQKMHQIKHTLTYLLIPRKKLPFSQSANVNATLAVEFDTNSFCSFSGNDRNTRAPA